MQDEVLQKLLQATWSAPVFGDSFNNGAKAQVVVDQINQIHNGAAEDLAGYIGLGEPKLKQVQVNNIVKQIIPKTISFCPALAAGEITDTAKLRSVAVAIGLMYWGDQSTDRGDKNMALAIKALQSKEINLPNEAQPKLNALSHIRTQIGKFAKPEDIDIVYDCFVGQVLLNEVKLSELSYQYLLATDKPTFLETHAWQIAKLMVVDAGFPSVSSSLYAIYRWQNPDLPSLPQLYSEPEITKLLQICNAVVRAADELGDWQMDSGQNSEWGIFTINLFNQAHPKLVEEFLKMAYIKPTKRLVNAFVDFHRDAASRRRCGEFIMSALFDHVKSHIKNLPLNIKDRHKLYITLCKRVLEIGKVNQLGDVALAGVKDR